MKLLRTLLIAACCLLGMASPSFAQTTFGSDCNSNVTISGGGLTLTADGSSTYRVCRAGNPKFSGRFYYTYTPSVAAGSSGIFAGVASGPTMTQYGGVDVVNCTGFPFNLPAGVCGGVISSGNGNVNFNGSAIITSTGASAASVVSAVAVDLDTDPPRYWFTPDANGTSGHSGGPLWNGSSSSSPEVPGTGIPTTGGTGALFGLIGQLEFPFAAIANSTAITFNFGAFSPFSTVLPSYSSWNTATGGPPNPGPLNPMESQVSNAPGWAAATAYSVGVRERVNAGPAWNGTAYTSGLKLCLFGLVTPGTSGSDPSVFNTACTSGTAAGRGGIPGGSWPGATTVTDGSVTWALLTVVDEISLTAAIADNNHPWATSTSYYNGAYVINGSSPPRSYVAVQSTDPCTSASSGTGPSGTSLSGGITDNTCEWAYRGDIVYSSHNAMPAHQMNYDNSGGKQEIGIYYDVHLNIWWGGTGTPHGYWAGHGNENDPITAWDISDLYGEAVINCRQIDPTNILPSGVYAPTYNNCGGRAWSIRYQPAPGDGFADNAPTGPLGTGDPSKGVMIYSDSTVQTGSFFPTGSAMLVDITSTFFNGLQIHSVNGGAIGGEQDTLTPNWNGHVNLMTLQGNILYAGGQGGVVANDAGGLAVNNLIIYNGANVPCYGLFQKFEGDDAFNTFIGPGLSNTQCSAILDFEGSFYTTLAAQKYGNAIFGFAVPWATGNPFNGFVTAEVGANNITDVPSSYTTSTYSSLGANYKGQQIVGTSVNSASATAAFVNPTVGSSLDARVANTSSPIYGAGASFTANGHNGTTNGYPGTLISFPPTFDVFALARPTSGRWDVGAQQFGGIAGPVTLTSVNLSGSTFTFGGSCGTPVGSITVSGTGGPTPTLSISGANTGGFTLSSSTLPSNLACSGTYPPSGGPFSDIHIIATQAGATGSPCDGTSCGGAAFTITGSGGPPPPSFLRVGGMMRIH